MDKHVEAPPHWARRAGRYLRKRWRPWLRALHRDAGYLAVGLTFIYAVSGLAINHIKDWDPNYQNVDHTYQVDGPFSEDEAEAARRVLDAIGVAEEPADAYYAADDQLEIEFNDRRIIHVDTATDRRMASRTAASTPTPVLAVMGRGASSEYQTACEFERVAGVILP